MNSTDSPQQPTTTPRSTWLIALGSSIALWLSFPPANLWPLAWVATMGWCWLIAAPKIRARRPYRLIYISALAHWLLVMESVRLPHWSAYFGWVVLAAYLAIYITLSVGLARVMVHQMRVPLCLACPIAWTGMEFVRSRFLSGFAMCLISHTQAETPLVIQIASIGGAYAVSFLMVLFAASLVQSVFVTPRGAGFRRRWPLALATIVLTAALLFGHSRLAEHDASDQDSAHQTTVSVALIQGCIDTTFGKSDFTKPLRDYRRLTTETMTKHPDVDLIIWPESMHQVTVDTAEGVMGMPWYSVAHPLQLDPDFPGDLEQFKRYLNYGIDTTRHEAGWFARNFQTPALVGVSTYDVSDRPTPYRFNSGLWLDASGQEAGRYDKMHPVMFGEYVPLGKIFPWLYQLTPMGSGLEPGDKPLAVTVQPASSSDPKDAIVFSPCICFENTVPHLVRRQVRDLVAAGQSPDALITLTNDGWFWGSAQLDYHLACGIFRAVELQRPTLIAANTGFSAWIDNRGRIMEQGPRRAEASIVARVAANQEPPTLYELAGDSGFALPCAVFCLIAAIRGWTSRRSIRG